MHKKKAINKAVKAVKSELKAPVVSEVAKTFEQQKQELAQKDREIEKARTLEYETKRDALDLEYNRKTIAIYIHQDGADSVFRYATAFLNKK